MEKRIKQLERKNREQEHEISRLITINNILKVENDKLRKQLRNLQRLANELYMEGSE